MSPGGGPPQADAPIIVCPLASTAAYASRLNSFERWRSRAASFLEAPWIAALLLAAAGVAWSLDAIDVRVLIAPCLGILLGVFVSAYSKLMRIELRGDSLIFQRRWSARVLPIASLVSINHWPKGSVRWEFKDATIDSTRAYDGIELLLAELARQRPDLDLPRDFSRTTRLFWQRAPRRS